MSQSSQQKYRRPERINLPFTQRKVDWVDWMYDKRVGLLSMVVVYLLVGIVVLSARINVGGRQKQEFIFLDIETLEQKQEETAEELARQAKQYEDMFKDVRNLESNENAKLDADLKDASGSRASDLYREAEQVQQRLRDNRESYMEGLREEQNMGRTRGDEGKSEKREERKVAGNVTVSFSLKGRSAVYLHVPAYQCENGGAVTVNIVVNRKGAVVSASIDKRESVTDPCLREMAQNAALISEFNIDADAPARQQGTISYIFIPQ